MSFLNDFNLEDVIADNLMITLIKQYLQYAEGCDFSLDRPFCGMTFEEWKDRYEPFSSIIAQRVDELLNDLKARKVSELDKLHLELIRKFEEVKHE